MIRTGFHTGLGKESGARALENDLLSALRVAYQHELAMDHVIEAPRGFAIAKDNVPGIEIDEPCTSGNGLGQKSELRIRGDPRRGGRGAVIRGHWPKIQSD